MTTTIQTVYEEGVLKPTKQLGFAEHQPLTLQLIADDDLPAAAP